MLIYVYPSHLCIHPSYILGKTLRTQSLLSQSSHFSGRCNEIGDEWLSTTLRDVSGVVGNQRGDTQPELEGSDDSAVEAET